MFFDVNVLNGSLKPPQASRVGGDDAANFENYAAVKQRLAHLRARGWVVLFW